MQSIRDVDMGQHNGKRQDGSDRSMPKAAGTVTTCSMRQSASRCSTVSYCVSVYACSTLASMHRHHGSDSRAVEGSLQC